MANATGDATIAVAVPEPTITATGIEIAPCVPGDGVSEAAPVGAMASAGTLVPTGTGLAAKDVALLPLIEWAGNASGAATGLGVMAVAVPPRNRSRRNRHRNRNRAGSYWGRPRRGDHRRWNHNIHHNGLGLMRNRSKLPPPACA